MRTVYRVNLFCRVCRRAVGEREWRKHLSHKVNKCRINEIIRHLDRADLMQEKDPFKGPYMLNFTIGQCRTVNGGAIMYLEGGSTA